MLTNGIEVKLQRNALSVIEAPTGNEEDDDLDFENMQWNGSDMGEYFQYISGFSDCYLFFESNKIIPSHMMLLVANPLYAMVFYLKYNSLKRSLCNV